MTVLTRALVWFKRDLRLADHAPLAAAAQISESGGAALGLFVVEPDWLTSPESDPQHLAFAQACLEPLKAALAERGLPLIVKAKPMLEVLAELHHATGFTHLLSHEETGSGWTYERDKAVVRWCKAHGVVWQQWPQNGVVRGLRDRRGWAGRWHQRMAQPLVAVPQRFRALQATSALGGAGGSGASALVDDPWPSLAQASRAIPPAGEAAAHAALTSFLGHRGAGYRKALSSPLSAQDGCSRLSAHLAFGSISMRQVHQATEAQIKAYAAQGTAEAKRMAYDLRGFASRLRWHCHFMQKLESEPAIEWRNFSRAFDGLREETEAPTGQDAERLAAWQTGMTGYPMVDACMRSLAATGWLNFRMRAMLVSFAAYHLWLHWRAPGRHLARQFLDFEPGIHWSQMQMQSGTTGINTVRMYSPTKQALDHDPAGTFIARWCPELAAVPVPLRFTPWKLSAEQQQHFGCVIGQDYPAPIVDEAAAAKAAKERIFAARGSRTAKAEADRVQAQHGSRKSGLPQSGAPRRTKRGASNAADLTQPQLF